MESHKLNIGTTAIKSFHVVAELMASEYLLIGTLFQMASIGVTQWQCTLLDFALVVYMAVSNFYELLVYRYTLCLLFSTSSSYNSETNP